MKRSVSRGRLLVSAAMGFGLATLASQSAQAACNAGATGTICGTTTTTDTDFPTNVGSDRHYGYGAGSDPVSLDITAGSVVDGFGLAFTNVIAGSNPLTITNIGTIQVDAGNTPTAGGDSAALYAGSSPSRSD